MEDLVGTMEAGGLVQISLDFDPSAAASWDVQDEVFLRVAASVDVAAVGCGPTTTVDLGIDVPVVVAGGEVPDCDEDQDGYVAAACGGLDCDDANAAVNPGASEVCNEIDDDCNGIVDIDSSEASTFYEDFDGDSYGDPAVSVVACEAPNGFVNNNLDCDDRFEAINPDAEERCDDIDNDCDGTIDGETAVDRSPFYVDIDGDGYGEAATEVLACDAPLGLVADGTDCDDNDASVNPAADEVCDLVDNDCDGTIDEPGAAGETAYYADADGDGYGDAAVSVTACNPSPGFVADGTDCDDVVASTNPGATEVCDGVDNDCSGTIDDGAANLINWYVDSDNDGYGAGTAVPACTQPAGYVDVAGDCDDTSAAALPGGVEVCDSLDNDCNGVVDDNPTDGITFFRDSDSDGFGLDSSTVSECARPSGYAEQGGDCDDGVATSNPDADEVCDGVDNDCDQGIDEEATDRVAAHRFGRRWIW